MAQAMARKWVNGFMNADITTTTMECNSKDRETNNNVTIADDCEQPLARFGCEDTWTWSQRHRSQEVVLSGPNYRIASFHPNWSKGTAGVRGTRTLNNGRYYWEIQISHRIFGTRFVLI